MAVPTQRATQSRRNKRRSHNALKQSSISSCAKCGTSVLPHHVCMNCGTYRGREVVNVLEHLEKKERKRKEKELAAQEQEQQAEKPLSAEELSKKS